MLLDPVVGLDTVLADALDVTDSEAVIAFLVSVKAKDAGCGRFGVVVVVMVAHIAGDGSSGAFVAIVGQKALCTFAMSLGGTGFDLKGFKGFGVALMSGGRRCKNGGGGDGHCDSSI